MYITAQLIVDGTQEEDTAFYGDIADEQFDNWLENLKVESNSRCYSDQKWEVFRIVHDHDHNVDECLCIQYLNDYNAYWSNA